MKITDISGKKKKSFLKNNSSKTCSWILLELSLLFDLYGLTEPVLSQVKKSCLCGELRLLILKPCQLKLDVYTNLSDANKASGIFNNYKGAASWSINIYQAMGEFSIQQTDDIFRIFVRK